MSTLYRTPNIVIDEFEFHMSVELREDSRVRRYLRWRPLARRNQVPWATIAHFKGHPPKPTVLKVRFAPFMKHMLQAERSVVENRLAAQALRDAA